MATPSPPDRARAAGRQSGSRRAGSLSSCPAHPACRTQGSYSRSEPPRGGQTEAGQQGGSSDPGGDPPGCRSM
eukprot:1431214-Alexandrium_andersonii.AAC.1